MKKLILASLLAASSTAFASNPTPSTTQNAARATAAHASGTVKSINATARTITVSVAGKDVTYGLGTVALGTTIKSGTFVDVTYTTSSTGAHTASAVSVHH